MNGGAAADGRADAALASRVEVGLRRAREHLLALQHTSGFWQGRVEANAILESEYIFLTRLLRRRPSEHEPRLVERLLALQGDDGGWALSPGGAAHLSTSIEAYVALRLAGVEADEPRLTRARDAIVAGGGIVRAGVSTRIWLACLGLFPWAGVPAMPVEMVLLPPRFPVNIHRLSSWARHTMVPAALLMVHRPEGPAAPDLEVSELWASGTPGDDRLYVRSPELVSWRNAWLVVDRGLKSLGRTAWRPLRRRAVARAIEWILRHQNPSGQWAGIQPAMFSATLALHTIGFALDHPVMVRALEGIDEFLVEANGALVYQPLVTPNWDTAWTVRALLAAGVAADDPALERAGRWLLSRQVFRPGDWSVHRPDLEPGGWSFESANEWCPSIDASAAITVALDALGVARGPAGRRALAYGTGWTLGMQSRGGGFAAFDADNTAQFLNQAPFAHMEALIDPPTADVTGRVLELMGTMGYGLDFGRVRRAIDFVRGAQRADGSWPGRWGVNGIYGTWCVLTGLAAVGEDPSLPHVRRAAEWLVARQNADGGWGEGVESYEDPALAGRGDSTPSQTAWALLALMAADGVGSPAVARGIDWLVRAQDAGGTWTEHAFTGTAFPHHCYLRFDLYRHYFPLLALARYGARSGE